MVDKVVRYSEGFKLQIVRELETGELKDIEEARRRYGIRGGGTIPQWLRKYGRNDLMPKVVRVENPNERNELKRLQRENERLKKALAETHMDAVLYRSWFEVACEELGVRDVEGFKKKLGGERLP